ncbi:hypothetical protein AAZV13_09G095850 [Glycine max]
MEQFLAIHGISYLNRSSFPQDFIFGSSSSAYQGSDFVAKAVDLAARELITSASLGQGLICVAFCLLLCILICAKLNIGFLQWQLHRYNLTEPRYPRSLQF